VCYNCGLLWPCSPLAECDLLSVICSLLSLTVVLLVLERAEEAGCQAYVQHSLQVREVVVVEEVGCQAYE
jgi:hypothetical protein